MISGKEVNAIMGQGLSAEVGQLVHIVLMVGIGQLLPGVETREIRLLVIEVREPTLEVARILLGEERDQDRVRR